ncbi:hypothetical protein E8E13_001482 [Curvularia kusanoi]|uniref:Uncharacterized protein n=1 Tax=Curvularia kusanoi TaxID=90978 RepID=A0A9P4T7D5_CURKU|nr:hypothetical protein E8E13_001482 [Curvularia kusanoi]
MSFIRSTALRASSVARAARPAIRATQPLRQSVQRRTYASGHGHSEAKTSDIPWMAAAVAGTVGGLYVVVNQDLGHVKEHHDDPSGHSINHDYSADEAPDGTNPDAPSVEADDANKEDLKKDEGEKEKSVEELPPKDSTEKAAEDKKKEKKEAKSETQEKTDDEADPSPDKSDKPNPRKEPKSFNEMSGKQQGMSNDDTHHTSQISKHDEKSKKGEGVAETAKVKGTVSTDRPPAENKEERGKPIMNKDE